MPDPEECICMIPFKGSPKQIQSTVRENRTVTENKGRAGLTQKRHENFLGDRNTSLLVRGDRYTVCAFVKTEPHN